jgi:hypothetical protein
VKKEVRQSEPKSSSTGLRRNTSNLILLKLKIYQSPLGRFEESTDTSSVVNNEAPKIKAFDDVQLK